MSPIIKTSRGNMGKIFLNEFLNILLNVEKGWLVAHTCSRGQFAHGHLFRDVPFKCWEVQIYARFRLLLPAAPPQHLSSLLEFTILRYSFFESHHISMRGRGWSCEWKEYDFNYSVRNCANMRPNASCCFKLYWSKLYGRKLKITAF